MAQSRQAIQARIQSVDSTKKITKAMQLVASSKLTRQRMMMEENVPYANGLEELLSLVLGSASRDSIYLKTKEDLPSYIFVITSDMGLCGGYNANIQRLVESNVHSQDKIVMIGSRGTNWIKNRPFQLVDTLIDLNEDDAYERLGNKMNEALYLYEKQEISSIQIFYTHYKNTITFVPTILTVLPVQSRKEISSHAEMIFEPGKEEMLANVIPMAARSTLYAKYLESKTSEQASRRMAMENATDNANELQSQLEFAFNQARQAAITQEITEIVSGANALS